MGVYPPVFDSNSVKQMIEEKSSKKVMQLRRINDDNVDVVLAIMQSGETCVATPTELCFCD